MGTLAKQFTILIKKQKTKQEPAGKQLNEQLRACDHVTEDCWTFNLSYAHRDRKEKSKTTPLTAGKDKALGDIWCEVPQSSESTVFLYGPECVKVFCCMSVYSWLSVFLEHVTQRTSDSLSETYALWRMNTVTLVCTDKIHFIYLFYYTQDTLCGSCAPCTLHRMSPCLCTYSNVTLILIWTLSSLLLIGNLLNVTRRIMCPTV